MNFSKMAIIYIIFVYYTPGAMFDTRRQTFIFINYSLWLRSPVCCRGVASGNPCPVPLEQGSLPFTKAGQQSALRDRTGKRLHWLLIQDSI
ncbi:MAG: hypothetical protein KME22_29770 [Hassallia sp. WJT32-NPBG1]|nr:hypothetical protein [Hassallia sp. WJT32-NPBG1]